MSATAGHKRARKMPSRYDEDRNDEKESLPPKSSRPKKVQSRLQFEALPK